MAADRPSGLTAEPAIRRRTGKALAPGDGIALADIIIILSPQRRLAVRVPALAHPHPTPGGTMSQPAVKIVTTPPEPSTALERLHADRAGLIQRLEQISATHARLRALGLVEAAVRQELDALSKADIQAVTGWAASGGEGEPPSADLAQRRALGAKLASAQAAANAATGSLHDLDHEIRELTAQLADAEKAIERAALDIAEREFSEIRGQHAAAMAGRGGGDTPMCLT
jgi:hypothetical protein